MPNGLILVLWVNGLSVFMLNEVLLFYLRSAFSISLLPDLIILYL